MLSSAIQVLDLVYSKAFGIVETANHFTGNELTARFAMSNVDELSRLSATPDLHPHAPMHHSRTLPPTELCWTRPDGVHETEADPISLQGNEELVSGVAGMWRE